MREGQPEEPCLRPAPSSVVCADVGRALEDLQLHVAAEVQHILDLLQLRSLEPRVRVKSPAAELKAWRSEGDARTLAREETVSSPCKEVAAYVGASESRFHAVRLAAEEAIQSQQKLQFNAQKTDIDFGWDLEGTWSHGLQGRPKLSSKERGSTTDLELRGKVDDLAAARQESTSVSRTSILLKRTEELVEPRGTKLQMLIRGYSFELFWICAVMANSLVIGVQTQYAAMHMDEAVPEPVAFRYISNFFSFLFIIELALRIYGVGLWKLFCGPNMAWAWFDTIIVAASIFEFVIETVLPSVYEDDTLSPSSLRTVRVIRLARFVRALRVQRLIHLVSGLRTLVYSIAVTLKSLVWALILLTIIMYTVGVALTQIVIDHLITTSTPETRGGALRLYWRSLDVSMFTLFQSISGGVSWNEAALPLGDVSNVLVWILGAYIAFTYFAVLNVVTGVFCHSAIESAQKNPDVIAQALIANQKLYIKNIERLFAQVDEDKSECITYHEFEKVISDPDNRAYLAALEIEAVDAWTLFKLLDIDKDGIIQMDEFVTGCLQLKGVAKNVEIADLSYKLDRLQRRLDKTNTHLQELLRPKTNAASAPTDHHELQHLER